MPVFRIPEGQKAAIATLVGFDRAQMQALLGYLRECGPSLISASAHKDLPESLNLDADAAIELVAALSSMYLSHESSWLTEDDLVRTIADDGDIGATKEGLAALKTFLPELFKLSDSFGLAAKMLRLRYDHANVLYRASIVSDLRPVFSTEVGRPRGFAVIHNLRMRLYPGDEKDVYVALDTTDLEQLREVVDRAIEKDRALRSMVEELDIPVYQEGMT